MATSPASPLTRPLLTEFDAEMDRTRRVIERLPDDKFAWQPHPKSMTAGKLASHTIVLVGWIHDAFKTTDLDLSDGAYISTPPFVASTRAELLAHFAALSATARATLVEADDEAMAQPWTMRRGEVVLVPPQPRAEIVRHLISHMIHHRGQVMVYLRLLEVPVPGIYGPSADEEK